MQQAEPREGWTVAPRTRAVLAALVALGLVLASCGTSGDQADDARPIVGTYANVERSEDPPAMGGVLRYGLPYETNSWNPGLGQWEAHSMQVARAIFDPLFEYDENGEPQPYLLERASHNDDYTEWTLVLREGVRFHNGEPVTANDIARAQVSYMNSPVYSSAWAINSLSGARIVDDRTLVVSSSKPWVTLPHQSASQLGFVPEPDWLGSEDWARPVGSGPFMVDSWVVGERLVLKRNPDYWRKDKWGNRLPYLDRIEFEIVTDDHSRYDLLRRGELDVMMQTAPGSVATRLHEAARSGAIQLVTDDRGESPEDLVLLNTAKQPFSDVEVRRALAAAIDREAFSDALTGGLSPPAEGPFEPTSPWYSPSGYPGYDPGRARSLLAAAEARRGRPLTFVLKGPDTAESHRAMQLIQTEWAKVGIDVRIEGVKLSNMLITMMTGDFDALLYQRFDYPNPATELVLVNPSQARPIGEFTLNFSRIRDDGLTQAIDMFLHSPDPGAHRSATTLLQRRLGDLVPILWLTHARRHIAARPGVVNLVNRTLPDGSPGLDFLIGSHRVDQIWRRP